MRASAFAALPTYSGDTGCVIMGTGRSGVTFMLTKQHLQARVRRLEQLIAGLNAELVRLAMEKEALNADEARVYRESIEEMIQGAKRAEVGLRCALNRLAREEESRVGASGPDLWGGIPLYFRRILALSKYGLVPTYLE